MFICLCKICLCYYNIVGASCTVDDLSMNSKCYRKIYRSSSLRWYSASNDCLSRGGSLAVFTHIGRPSDNRQLTAWLNTSRTHYAYWIGLVRSWWKTTNEGEFEDAVPFLSGKDIGHFNVCCYFNVVTRLTSG